MAKKIEKAKIAYEKARAMLKAKKLQHSLEQLVNPSDIFFLFCLQFHGKKVLHFFIFQDIKNEPEDLTGNRRGSSGQDEVPGGLHK